MITISRTFSRSWHDMRCFTEAALVELLQGAGDIIPDKGYQGIPATIPIKKQPDVELADADRELNRQLSKIRTAAAAEGAMAYLKN